MATSRHKHAVPRRAGLRVPAARDAAPASSNHRGSRRVAAPSPWHRSAVRLALPAIGVMTLLGTSAAVVAQEGDVSPAVASTSAQAPADDIIASALEQSEVSRSSERPELPAENASLDIKGVKLALRDGVAVHADADPDSPVLATLDKGDEVDVTGEKQDGWAQVAHKGLPRWVPAKQIADELPPPPLGTQPCPVGSEGGLQPDTVKVLRAVCAAFPQVTSYGGIANRGEHATGHALDIMVTGALGDQIAAFLQKNRAELGIEYLIWEQRIWRPSTSGAWRGMGDRGGATANHFDHVHVTTYGSAATG